MNYYNVLLAKKTKRVLQFGSLYERLFESWINRARQILKDLPTGSISTVNDAAELPLNALKVSVEAWQEGTGDPSPSNIRPIHGWSEANIKDGVNIVDWDKISFKNGYYIDAEGNEQAHLSYKYTIDYIEVKPNTTYSIQAYYNSDSALAITVPFYNNQKNFISRDIVVISDGKGTFSGQFTTPNNCHYVRFSFCDLSWNYCLEIGNTAHDYNTFNHTYTQQFPQTIYGAEWDVVNGGMAEGYGYAEYDGSEAWVLSPNGVGRFYLNKLPSGISSVDKADTISNQATYKDSLTEYGAFFVIGAVGIYINRLSESETLLDLRARLSNEKFTIKYKLATPTTIQLSPLSIRLLEGVNNVYADCGEVLSGKYWANV